MYYRLAGSPSNLNNIHLINENGKEVSEGEKLGDLPVLVLSSDSGRQWEKVQKQLAGWSTKSKQITIKGAEHYLYWSHTNEVKHWIEKWLEKMV